MSFANPPFSVRRGDDRLIEIAVSEADGSPVPLAQATVSITYGPSDNGPALATRTEQSEDVSIDGGVIRYRMRPAETLSLRAFTLYRMQARITINGFRETVAEASFSVLPTQGGD